jgi:hypothetical protein
MNVRNSQMFTAGIATLILLIHGSSRGPAQELDPKKQEAMLAFAEKFLIAVDKGNRSLKNMVALPFIFYAPCKGGTATSFEEFDVALSRLSGVLKPPKAYDKKKVVTIERYVGSLPDEMFAKEKDQARKEREAHIKSLGKDLRVVYLVHGKKDGDFALAVLVRVTAKGFRSVGMGGIMEEASR